MSLQIPLLAGDIGATKTTLALYTSAALDQPGSAPYRQETFQNRAFSCFDDVLAVFLGPGSRVPPFACIGIAGPVVDDAAEMTNLNWRLDARELERRHGFTQVRLLNDLAATAVYVPCLDSRDLGVVNVGAPPAERSVMAVLAPGTGLGEAFLIPGGKYGYVPCASEGGHVSFAPRDDMQLDLLEFMLKRSQTGHVSVEDVCSGRAIPELFAFMGARHPVPDWLDQEIAEAADPTPVIVEAAKRAVEGRRVCGVAVHTMHLFCDILADEAANLALKTLALGGIYLAGGLALHLQPFLKQDRFMRIFTRDGSVGLLKRVPVHLVLNRQSALLGAGEYGLRALVRRQQQQNAVVATTPSGHSEGGPRAPSQQRFGGLPPIYHQ